VLVVDDVEWLGIEVVLPDDIGVENIVVEEVTLEDRAKLIEDVAASVDRPGLEDAVDGADVETVAPELPMVTTSVLEGTWNRLVPESQHPAI
jgi:hypothetical protein